MYFQPGSLKLEKNIKELQTTTERLDLKSKKIFSSNIDLSSNRMYRRFNHQNLNYKTIQQLTNQLNTYQPKTQLINLTQLRKNSTSTIKKYKESVYFGQMIDGVKNGKGIMTYTNGRIYEGQWDNNSKHGKGYQQFQNGAIYEGSFVKGKPQGYGTYTWDNGQTYEGQWINGMKNGSGIWRGPKGDSYIGQWKDGKADGYGVHTWVNGDRYEGQFVNCLKHGEGVQKFANGDSYKGFYEDGKPSGFGQYYWATGSYFKGNFKEGLRNGNGIWKRGPGDSDKYEGQYKDDKKDGYGVFIWANGNLYKGNFQSDEKHGYGEMYWADGKSYKGQWEHDHQVEGNRNVNYDNFAIIVNNKKKKKSQKKINANVEEFYEQKPFIYHQPKHPSIFQAQKKFRARELSSKKSTRFRESKTPKHYLSQSYSNQPRAHKKYITQTDRAHTHHKRSSHSHHTEKNAMSSSFFLYKIHGKDSQMNNNSNVAKPRVVKTSGGVRQKQISQEVKNFTKNKINSNIFD